MPQYPDIFYHPFTETTQAVDTVQAVDTIAQDSVVPSFITSGFDGTLTPLVRMSYEILQGWNLALLGILLLLIVINKQLYPRQFRQVLSVPGGVAHTNQLIDMLYLSLSLLSHYFHLSGILFSILLFSAILNHINYVSCK